MKYVTLDTGLKGAMVLFEYFEPVDSLAFEKMGQGVDSFKIAEKLREWEPDRIYIEQITARPKQSAKATATQFFVVGQCHTLAQIHCDHVEYIYPQTWTSFTKRLSHSQGEPSKVIAQELAMKFYPEFCKPYLTPRSRKVHDGIADCLCIHMYVHRDHYISSLV